jgi:shikimate kinase/shikimate 5-dehydrogenase
LQYAFVRKKTSYQKGTDVWKEFDEIIDFDFGFGCFEPESDHEVGLCIKEAADKGIKGLSIAAPLQYRAFQSTDLLSEEAMKTGLADTVRIENGVSVGYNTEYFGFLKALSRTGLDLTGKKVLVTGYSCSLNTVVAALKDLNVSETVIASIDKKRYSAKFPDCTVIHEEEPVKGKDFALFVNCGPVGMFPDTGSVPAAYDLSADSIDCVIDLVYHPWDTALVKKARKKGKNVQNGMWTAVYQTLKAFEIWTGTRQTEELAEELFYRMKKKAGDCIVLIGMPGSGKSTVGRTLAKTLDMEFVDTDEYIESFYGQIADLFDIGEEFFRQIETRTLKQLSYGNSMVISTGGGIVTREENIPLLKNAGKVFFLDRSPELIIQNEELKNRPLLAGEDRYEKLMRLYRQRIDLYRKAADYIINHDRGIFQTVQAIKEHLQER